MKKVKKQEKKKNTVQFFEKYNNIMKNIIIFSLIFVYAAILIKTAWVCDDAYITFRTVDNFVNGYGLTWNISERVQVYTHPLWMFLFSFIYFFSREAFFTSIFLSISISIFTVILITKVIKNKDFTIVGLLVLILSKSYTDFSTSGLENPLSHLLIVIFYIYYLKLEYSAKDIFLLSFVTALGILNRMDLMLFYLPPLLYFIIKLKKIKNILTVFYGFLILIIWELFSLLYYGFLFPNTYYAKIKSTGISQSELFAHGYAYFKNSINMDPVTLTSVVIILIIVFYSLPKFKYNNILTTDKKGKNIFYIIDNKTIPLILGLLIYLFYVFYIGGDFMTGRFFSVPLLISVLLLSFQLQVLKNYLKIALFIIIILIGIISPFNSLLSDREYRYADNEKKSLYDEYGINDERGFYYKFSNLIDALKGKKMPNHKWIEDATEIRSAGGPFFIVRNIGYQGYFAGKGIYILDELGLSDPLMARLPRVKTDSAGNKIPYIIGHYPKLIPEGYIKTIGMGKNYLVDEKIKLYYEKLEKLTKGDIFSFDRFIEIFKMNTGYYDYLIDKEDYSISSGGVNAYRNIELMSEMIESFPVFWLGYLNRGNLYFAQQEFDKAYNDINTAIELAEKNKIRNPNLIIMYYDRGCIYHYRKQYDKAKSDLNIALEVRAETKLKGSYMNQHDNLIGSLRDLLKDIK